MDGSPPDRRAVVSGSGLEPGPEGAHVDVDLVGGVHLLPFQHAFGVAGVRLPAGAQEGSGAPVHDDVDATVAVGAAASAGPGGLQRGGAVRASWVGDGDFSSAREHGGPTEQRGEYAGLRSGVLHITSLARRGGLAHLESGVEAHLHHLTGVEHPSQEEYGAGIRIADQEYEGPVDGHPNWIGSS